MRFLDCMGIIQTHRKALARSVSFQGKDFLSILYDVIFFFSIAPLFYLWSGVMITRIESVTSIDFFGVHELNELALLNAQSELFGFLLFLFVSLLIFFVLSIGVYALTHHAKWNLVLGKKFSFEKCKLLFWVTVINLLPWFILFVVMLIWFGTEGAIVFALLYPIGFYFHSLGKLLVYHHNSVKQVLKEQYVLGFKRIGTFILSYLVIGLMFYAMFMILGTVFSPYGVANVIFVSYAVLAIIIRKYFSGVVEAVR